MGVCPGPEAPASAQCHTVSLTDVSPAGTRLVSGNTPQVSLTLSLLSRVGMRPDLVLDDNEINHR